MKKSRNLFNDPRIYIIPTSPAQFDYQHISKDENILTIYCTEG